MANLNNPGRAAVRAPCGIHRAAEHGTPVRSIWGEVLGIGVEDPELYRRVENVAGLPGDIGRAVAHLDDEVHWEVVEYNTIGWAQLLFPNGVAFTQSPPGADKLLNNDQLHALASLASYFRRSRQKAATCPRKSAGPSRRGSRQIKTEIADGQSIDPQLRAVLLRRLHDIRLALDTYKVTGPQGLRDAREILSAAIVLDEKEHGEGRVPAKFREFLKDAYTATTVLTTTYAAIDGAFTIAGLVSRRPLGGRPSRHR